MQYCVTDNLCFTSLFGSRVQRGCLKSGMVEGCSYSFKEVKTVCCDSNFCNQIDSILTDITSIDNFTIITDPSMATFENHSTINDKFSKTFSIYPHIIYILILVIPLIIFLTYWAIYKCIEKVNSLVNMNQLPKCKLFRQSKKTKLDIESHEHEENFPSNYSYYYQQKTLVNELTFESLIEKNPQTELWKGKYQNDNVAIKCYMPGASSSWERELKIYKSASSRNNNILRYIGADISRYYYCIVFDYYDNQSLYDFLRCPKNSMFGLSLNQIYMIAYTASKGLSYLHSNIFGADPKPTICHRDIKSKNILIKSICGNLNATINLTPIPRNKYQSDHCINYTKDSNLNKSNNNDKTYCSINCCISDLGLAITDDEDYSSIKLKVGTHRYMSPEILSETLDRLNFESFKMSDVYSFALVLWEIISCYNPFYPNPPFKLNCFHELPYHEFVSQNPSLDDMKTIVVDKNLRPSLQFNWYKSEKILPFLEIIKESWSSNPKSRLSAIRIKLTLQKSCSGMSII